ncbi:MAG: hypothetical protein ABW252_07980 [Polyangiales bacterium]
MVFATACGDDDSTDDGDDPDASQLEQDGSTPPPDGGPGNDGGPNIDSGQLIDAAIDSSTPGNDAGSGSLSANVQSIAFGLSPCGAGTGPEAKTITFTNNGTAPVQWSASLSSTTAFSLSASNAADAGAGALSGTLNVGASQTFSIAAAAVPSGAVAGQNITATLNVTTNLAAPYAMVSVPVTITPQGAHLTVNPAGGADWTLVTAGQPASPLPVTLGNTGNLAAAVTITQPSVTQFKLNQTADIASPLALSANVPAATTGGAGTVALTARFAPNIVGAYTSGAALAVTGAVCNGGPSASAASIPFRGAASGLGLTVEATTALPDRVNCGASGAGLPKAIITVGNRTENPVTVALALQNAGASAFEINKTSLTLQPGTTDTVEAALRADQALITAVPGAVRSDALVVTPPNGSGLNQVLSSLTTTVQGSVLTIGAVTQFNGATALQQETKTVSISNTGNLAAHPVVTLTGANANLFAVTAPLDPAGVPAGSTSTPGAANITVGFTPPVGDDTLKNAAIEVAAGTGDTICQPLAAPRAISGVATTAGFRLTTPSSGSEVAFGTAGAVPCPDPSMFPTNFLAAPADKTVVFENTSTATTLNWTATTTTGFTPVPASGTLLAGQTQTVTISAAPLPFPPIMTAGTYDGTITISKTNIIGASDTVLTLKQQPTGGIIEVFGGPNSFGDVNVRVVGSTPGNLFSLRNIGNAPADIGVTSSVSAPGGSTAQFEVGSSGPLGNGGSYGPPAYTLNESGGELAFTGTYDPSTGGMPIGADITQSTLSHVLATLDPVCDVLPTVGPITGTGTNANVTYSGLNMGVYEFPTAACNAPNAPRSLIITNAGNLPLTITSLTMDGGLGSPDTGDGDFYRVFVGTQGNVGNIVVPPEDPDPMVFSPGTVAITVRTKPLTGTEWNMAGGSNGAYMGNPNNSPFDIAEDLTIVTDNPQFDAVIPITTPVSCAAGQ